MQSDIVVRDGDSDGKENRGARWGVGDVALVEEGAGDETGEAVGHVLRDGLAVAGDHFDGRAVDVDGGIGGGVRLRHGEDGRPSIGRRLSTNHHHRRRQDKTENNDSDERRDGENDVMKDILKKIFLQNTEINICNWGKKIMTH